MKNVIVSYTACLLLAGLTFGTGGCATGSVKEASYTVERRYSGTWSQQGYDQNLVRLREWMKAQALAASGDPVWARYNAPLTPWLLRRNEILVPVDPGERN